MEHIDYRKASERFNVQKMEDIFRATNGVKDKPHRHDYYTVLFVEKAEGVHMVDFNPYTFGDSELHFVSPGQVHQVALSNEPRGTVITFSKDFLVLNNIPREFISNLSLFKPFGLAPPMKLDALTKDRLTNVIDDMMSCISKELNYRSRALGALLQLFLIFSNNSVELDKSQTDERDRAVCLIRDFKGLVDSNYNEWHKLGPYANKINVTTKHLSATVKQHTGLTAKEVIQDRIILEAKRMLVYSDFSIKEIAYKLGFKEPLHFSGFFKKAEGVSPTKFREQNAKSAIFIY